MLPPPANPEHILLIRLKSIGDIVFTLPAVCAVRDNFPQARLSFLVSQEHVSILAGFEDIDEIIPLDRRLLRSRNVWSTCAGGFRLLRSLRQPAFSHAVDLQGYGETEWLAWWSGAPECWGHKYNHWRGWLYGRQLVNDPTRHPAEGNLALLRQCGLKTGAVRNDFVVPPAMQAEARRFFAAHHLSENRPTLFIQPFTSAAHKNWPLEKFLTVALCWRDQGCQVIFGGGPRDLAALQPAVAAGFPVSAGSPLLVSAGLMKLSTLVLGADTGLLHLAVALGRRVVMLMGSREPGSTHPFQHPDWAVTPGRGKTVAEIETSRVRDAVAQALAEIEPVG
jgi:ADP-heptose:LPS heptosyltransferase